MDSYCKLFIAADESLPSLQSMIEKEFSLNTETMSFINIDFNENDEQDFENTSEFPDGFLYFEYYLDISLKDDTTDINKMIGFISNLLSWLWDHDFPAIASCEYEHLLPEKGGYQSQNIPWRG